MNQLQGITVVMGLCVLLAPVSAWTESSPFVGRWRWNQAQSTLPPGEPVPKDLICDIARADDRHVQWSITVLTAEGQPPVETFDTVANGEFYPISRETGDWDHDPGHSGWGHRFAHSGFGGHGGGGPR